MVITPVRFGSWETGSVCTQSPPTRTCCQQSASNVTNALIVVKIGHLEGFCYFVFHFLFVCSHRRSLPVDWRVRQHRKGLESPGLDATEDARWTRGEGRNTDWSFQTLLLIGGDSSGTHTCCCVFRWWVSTCRLTGNWLRPAPMTEPLNSGCLSDVMMTSFDVTVFSFLEEKMFQCFSLFINKVLHSGTFVSLFLILNTMMSLQNCKLQNTNRRINIRHQHLIKYITKTLSQQGALGVWQQTQWLVEWWL